MNENPIPLRSAKDGPFCWQSKPALRRIREHFDGRRDTHTAIAAYVALTEIASDQQSEWFRAEQSYIAHKAGMSARTLGPLLPDLEAAGVLRTRKTALKAPLIYELLLTDQKTLPNDQQLLPNDTQSLPNARQVTFSELPTVEERNEEKKEERRKVSAPAPTLEALIEEFKDNPAYKGIDVTREAHKMANWCATNGRHATRKRFINWLNRCESPIAAPQLPQRQQTYLPAL